ncbi:Uncharacterised protein [Halioglobus japonicus]|nr:Uncharacterised protein [Halioglobus japonicus]
MKFLSVMKRTGLCLAIGFAGQANASLIGSFSGSAGSITPWKPSTNGDLAADIAADSNAPFNLGTLFSGNFSIDDSILDSDPGASVGMYRNSMLSFSISGGDLNSGGTAGWARVSDNESVGGQLQDAFKVGASGFNDNFLINGNTWTFEKANIILTQRDTNPSTIFDDDSLPDSIASTTPWTFEQLSLTFTQQGVADSEHFLLFGTNQPNNDFTFSLTSSPTPSAAVPVPATLPLLVGALGLLRLRRRK